MTFISIFAPDMITYTASTPRLWVFNPGHEEALSFPQHQHLTLSKEIRWMRYELAPLLRLLASGEDLIYAPASPEGAPARLLNAEGETLPKDTILPPELLVTIWGVEAHILRELKNSPLLSRTTLHLPKFTEAYLQLSHRRASAELLQYLADELGYPSGILPLWIEAAETKEETQRLLLDAISKVTQRALGSPRELIVKRPYSSSGRGVQPLPLPVQEKHLEALVGSCMRSGSLSLEPYLEVIDNWAIEYTRDGSGKVRFFDLSHFDTLPSGRAYRGNTLASPMMLWEGLTRLIGEESLERLIEAHTRWLEERLRSSEYIGYIGVDLFLYREKGQLCLHPCVEINLRTTMGVLAHFAYEQYVPEGKTGIFRLERGRGSATGERVIPLLLTGEDSRFTAFVELDK